MHPLDRYGKNRGKTKFTNLFTYVCDCEIEELVTQQSDAWFDKRQALHVLSVVERTMEERN